MPDFLMTKRERDIIAFLNRAGWGDAARVALAADASARSYQRLFGAAGTAVLMNAPVGGDQLKSPAAAAYNRTAHLAVDCRPFVAIDGYLRRLGLSAPEIFAADVGLGLLLLEDLGDDLFASVLMNGAAEEEELYAAAIDVLLSLHTADVQGDGFAEYDADALAAEVSLLTEWYAPLVLEGELSGAALHEYQRIWQNLFPALLTGPRVLVLRDFHAQNLFWLPQRSGAARVGLIDFQDGVLGSPAYDLVSLLEDARRDVSAALAETMLARYCDGALKGALKGTLPFNEAAFRAAYAVAGAQRNAKILGIFARLAKRDGKPAYLNLLPRVEAHFRRNLGHPALAPLKSWFSEHLPLGA